MYNINILCAYDIQNRFEYYDYSTLIKIKNLFQQL